METILTKTSIESPMTMCEQGIAIMKKSNDVIKGIEVESPMTMCEQSIAIMKKSSDVIKGIEIESPMTMCEQSIAIMKKSNESDVLNEDVISDYEKQRKRSSIENLENYSMIKRMIV